MTAEAITCLFLTAISLTLFLRLWLAGRQLQSVSRHRRSVPAAFAGRFSLADHQLAADYTQAKVRLSQISAIVDTLLLLALTLGGGIAWLQSAIGYWLPAGDIIQGVALFVAVLAISGAVGLPATLYSTFVIEARFGFNRTSPGLFMLDQIKGMAVGLVLGMPLLALVLWLFVAAGAQWWLWTWLVWSGFSLAMMWLFPTVIAPVFNRFEPLQDGELKQRIDALLARCGFRSSGVFVVDGSKRSSHGNAYFTGFGAAKRIVFYDTLIRQLDPDEIEAVLAHELGHFRLRHVAKRITVTLGLALVLLWILGGLAMLPAFYAGLGVATPSPAAALLLFMLVVPVLTFPFTPLASWSSRQHEFEADAFAAGHASAACLVSALTKLYRDNASTLTPDPLYSAFYDSHPPAAIRIQALENLQPG
ncbi:M48 family metallopeptidase [Laribacter hongkongensis]|uniref:Putative transmembrane protease n=1 Tax=Laribacter hongkongensis TaxID=168471 RepID=A0A248LI54_9NEIS|nr:M48 family metallopeptidase [Laribacter hongkongensis]ASJ24470.1 putative transmembrane protease [Laribacter hongkongensis]MCG9040282.1 M48 family metallopeptidase [Laribacter hongkongensis]MCG9068318.1 M48 family metallopeptidase [Laribacter hongkongensis]MCG9088265.1 M48 family metallopeptidase [Laribacter hongkongensis]MCG9108564.1 M48 family metallopeptidase [Laribacter hongkongensis]